MKCTAIAYEWLLELPRENGPDFILVVASCQMDFETTKGGAIRHDVYHAKFRPPDRYLQLTDVSGTLGLLWQSTEQIAQQRAETFERMLADAIVWSFRGLNFDRSDKHVVLIQGPLIPKLRGRQLYRGFDPGVPIYSVTYQMEWLRRMEAANTAFEKLTLKNDPQVGRVYPPKEIDRATRSWVCRLPREPAQPLHFEVIANMWDCCEERPLNGAGSWLDQREAEILGLIKTGQLEAIDAEDTTRLPRSLAIATREARIWKQCEDSYSKLCRAAEQKFAPETLQVDKALASPEIKHWKMAFGEGFLAEDTDDLLAAASKSKLEVDYEKSYVHLTNNWRLESVQRATKELLKSGRR